MPALTGTANVANTTLYSTFAASYTGLALDTILPVILIAALIISLTIGCLMAFKKSNFFLTE